MVNATEIPFRRKNARQGYNCRRFAPLTALPALRVGDRPASISNVDLSTGDKRLSLIWLPLKLLAVSVGGIVGGNGLIALTTATKNDGVALPSGWRWVAGPLQFLVTIATAASKSAPPPRRHPREAAAGR